MSQIVGLRLVKMWFEKKKHQCNWFSHQYLRNEWNLRLWNQKEKDKKSPWNYATYIGKLVSETKQSPILRVFLHLLCENPLISNKQSKINPSFYDLKPKINLVETLPKYPRLLFFTPWTLIDFLPFLTLSLSYKYLPLQYTFLKLFLLSSVTSARV